MTLRFPRPVIVTAAIVLAVAWTALGSVPALADQVRQQQWWLAQLHVTQAQRTSDGSGVTIALLDTGVDPAQPDIAGSVITGPDYTHAGEKPGGPTYGLHGTAMASLIVGHGHGPGGADGILGVAPGARLLSVRVVLDATDPLASDSAITSGLPAAIAAGIMYAVRSGAQVIDLPLDPGQSPSALAASTAPAPVPGTPPTPAELAQQAAAGGSAAEQAAVSFALSKGVVLVAPAGDNGTGTDEVNFPASYHGVISVGAFDSNFIKAPFTSHQSYVTLTAAGSGMTAAVPTGYATVSSTSAASAVVTGIAALIKSVYPELTPAQVTQALTSGTRFRPPGGLNGSGHGTADAAKALAAAAVIAKPGPPRAGAGAVARPLPAAPSVPFIDKSLGRTLVRDALISLAVLIVLLLPIAGYVLVRRRRVRTKTTARPERELGARSAYAPSASNHADEMLEYFATMPAPSAAARGTRPPDAAAGPVPGPGWGSAAASPPDTHPGAGAGVGTGVGNGAAAGRIPRTPISRPGAPRPPVKVTGTPPWEPADKPDSELPWATRVAPSFPGRSAPAAAPLAPAAPAAPARPPAPAGPTAPAGPAAPAAPQSTSAPSTGSIWEFPAVLPRPAAGPAAGPAAPAASTAPAAPQNTSAPTTGPIWEFPAVLPRPAAGPAAATGPTAGEGGGADQADQADQAGENGRAGEADRADEEGHADEDVDLDGGPIYVWNPTANTETFPSVPRVPGTTADRPGVPRVPRGDG